MSVFPLFLLLLVVGYCCLLAEADEPIQSSFDYGNPNVKVRGVNIGGWLVLEPWITPSIFDNTGDPNIVDEYTLCQQLGTQACCEILEEHWGSFYTAADFAYMEEAGLNHVRIPIGYWAFAIQEGDPYCKGNQVYYLRQAIQWAEAAGLKVIIDLHGAPGSQNGFDNSGQRKNSPGWQDNYANIELTLQILMQIYDIYIENESVVTGIELLNEPLGSITSVLEAYKPFVYNGYGELRYPYENSTQSDVLVVYHDAFQPEYYWNGFAPPPAWQGFMVDTHIYQVFTNGDVAMTQAQHISAACSAADGLTASGLWTIVGEWTTAATDCAKYLNGRGIGARYDGTYPGSTYVGDCTGLTGPVSSFSEDYKAFIRQYWEAQVTAYEQANGWVYWCWKNEQADDWSYFDLLLAGVLSWDVMERIYPDVCNP